MRSAPVRVLITFDWTYIVGGPAYGPRCDTALAAHARKALLAPLAGFRPEVHITPAHDGPRDGERTSRIYLEVDLADAPGPWRHPGDHIAQARAALVEAVAPRGVGLIASVQRFARTGDPDGATGLVEWDDGFHDRAARVSVETAA